MGSVVDGLGLVNRDYQPYMVDAGYKMSSHDEFMSMMVNEF